MATITSAGIGSGIDVESLISRLVSLERQPITQLAERTSGLKTQLSAVGKIQSNLSALRDAASKLSNLSSFGSSKVTSSDATSVTAAAGEGAALGTYAVQVNRLAQAQSVASNAVPAGTGLGTGTITIEFGKFNADLSAFDADPSRTSLIIPIASGEDELSSIRDKINAMKAGIVANVVTDVNGSRLVMRAVDSGAANAFRVSVADGDGINDDANGLSRLAYDPTQGINASARKQAAQNSEVLIDGVLIESANNKIEGAIEGVTVDLQKIGSANLTIAQDQEATKKLVTDFVNAYNTTITQLREVTKNDKDAGTGPLRGDQTIIGIQNQLRQLVGSTSSLGGSFSRLAEIGLDPGSNGLLTVNDTKLTAALAKPADLKTLFAGRDAGNADNNGFAVRLRALADQFLAFDGRIESRKKSINESIELNGDRTEQMERRVGLVEKRLRQQYTALDATMGRNTGLSSYLQQQLSRLG